MFSNTSYEQLIPLLKSNIKHFKPITVNQWCDQVIFYQTKILAEIQVINQQNYTQTLSVHSLGLRVYCPEESSIMTLKSYHSN